MGEARQSLDAPSAPTLHEWATRWFKTYVPTWDRSTVVSRSRAYRLHIRPALGDLMLTDVDKSVVEEWLRSTGGGSLPRHLELAYETLRAMVNRAVRDEVLDRNRMVNVELPKKQGTYIPDDKFALTPQQLTCLISACTSLRDETLVRVAAEVGLRRGELAGLRWQDIDLESRRINVNQAIWQDKKVGKIAKAPKSGVARRVAISTTTVERLRDYRREQSAATGGIPSGPVWPGRGTRAKGSEWDTTQPMSPSSISHIIGRLMRNAKLVGADGVNLLGTQGLRRTAGSIPLMAGKPLISVSKQLGHSKVTTTANSYARCVQDEQLDDVASAFEAVDAAAATDDQEVGK